MTNTAELRSEILVLLRRADRDGMNIREVSDALGINWIKTDKELYALEAMGKVRSRVSGRSKLYFLKETKGGS